MVSSYNVTSYPLSPDDWTKPPAFPTPRPNIDIVKRAKMLLCNDRKCKRLNKDKYGRNYGVKLIRPLWKRIVLSLPLIRRKYGRKVRLDVVCMTDNKRPMCGIFEDFWIFNSDKLIPFVFSLPMCAKNAMFYRIFLRDNKTQIASDATERPKIVSSCHVWQSDTICI